MAELEICLLGSFEVAHDFVPVPPGGWRNPFAARLLKLLLLRRTEPIHAEEAVRLVGHGMVRADLGTALEQVRRVLQPAATIEHDDSGMLGFRAGAHCWIDVDAFEQHYSAGVKASNRGDMLPAILALQEADALYQGALLEELQDPWVLAPRRRLQQMYTDTLDRLAEGHAVLARYQDAVGFCHKALSHDPARESTYQRLMVYYYYLSDAAGVRDAYLACRDALGRVSAQTEELWGQLSVGQFPRNAAADVAASADP